MINELIDATTLTIVGRKGLGKTVGSAILVNNIEKNTVVFDITGAYTQDELIQDALYLAIDTKVDSSTIVLILKQFKEKAKKRIVLNLARLTRKELVDFTEIFFKIVNQVGDVAIVIDEIGEVASQQREFYSPELERCCRIGRNYGIKPFIMITQRTQKADKNILALSDYYLIFGLTHNLDLQAVQDLSGFDKETFEPIKKYIKNLGVGKCVVLKYNGEMEKIGFDMDSQTIYKVKAKNSVQEEMIKEIENKEGV